MVLLFLSKKNSTLHKISRDGRSRDRNGRTPRWYLTHLFSLLNCSLDELNQDEPTVGDSGEEEEYDEAESDEDVPEIILPSTSDIQAHTQAHTASRMTRFFPNFSVLKFSSGVGVANYLQTPIHLGAARQAAVTSKARTKTSVLELDIDTYVMKNLQKNDCNLFQLSFPICLSFFFFRKEGNRFEFFITFFCLSFFFILTFFRLEDKPWRKPGVDITQYFNYGFNEDTWRAYCGRQHQMKMESQNLGKISVYESNRENEVFFLLLLL